MRESELRFRSIYEKALNGIAFAGMDGVLLDANDSLATLLGYTRSELQGMSIAHFTHPDDLSVEGVFLEEMRIGQRDSYRMDKRYLTRTGGTVSVDLLVKLIRDERGEPWHVVGMASDITERKQAESKLFTAREMIRSSVAAARVFPWEWDVATDRLTWGVSPEVLLGVPRTSVRPILTSANWSIPTTSKPIWRPVAIPWPRESLTTANSGSSAPTGQCAGSRPAARP